MNKYKSKGKNSLNWILHAKGKIRLAIIVSISLFILIGNPCHILAWNSRGVADRNDPLKGLIKNGIICEGSDYEECLGTHEWIVHKAIEYLREYDYITQGSWFDTDDFKDLLQWGVGYADDTGKKISAGFIHTESWDIDGFRHFYHPADIWVRITSDNADSGITGLAHVGGLTAQEYANQLYQRAIEFWPYGTSPLDLSTINDSLFLGATSDNLDNTYYAGWGQGTDPRLIWEVPTYKTTYDMDTNESCGEVPFCYEDITKLPEDWDYWVCDMVEVCVPANRPQWPPWVKGAEEENKETAAVFLGWALHMIQDMAVYHHTKNLHGIPHQNYEKDTENMIKENIDIFNDQLPIPPVDPNDPGKSGQPFCTKYLPCNAYFECSEELEHCYDIFPDIIFYDLNSFDAKDLANHVAYFAYDQKKKEIYSHSDSNLMLFFDFDNEAYVKHCLDAAIKASAALIYKYISDVSQEELPEDKFEPNNDQPQAWLLNSGSYTDLAISDNWDDDWYLIKMPYRGDLTIRIDYDTKLGNIGSMLHGPFQPRVPMKDTQGSIFNLKGIAAGDYYLHLTSGITTAFYNLHVNIGGERLEPDDWEGEGNNTIETANETLFRYSDTTANKLTIETDGDNDYYVVEAPIGYQIEASIEFNQLDGELRMFFNNDEVTAKQAPDLIADSSLIDKITEKQAHDHMADLGLADDERLVINGDVLNGNENKLSISPNPLISTLLNIRKTLSIKRCSSGRNIIRITGQPNEYSLSVSKITAIDECGINWTPENKAPDFKDNLELRWDSLNKYDPTKKLDIN